MSKYDLTKASFSLFPLASVIDEFLEEGFKLVGDVNYWANKFSGAYPNYPVSSHFVDEGGTSILTIAVPGFSKDDINTVSEGDKLTIIGKKKNREGKPGVFLHEKLAQRDFDIAFKCSSKMDLEKATAKLKDGILTLEIPLKEEEKPMRKVIELSD